MPIRHEESKPSVQTSTSPVPLPTCGLFAVVAALIVWNLAQTARQNAQLLAHTERHNAQLTEQAETHNAQLRAQAAEFQKERERASEAAGR